MLVVALGIDSAGEKTVLGLRQGATENSEVCTSLLADLVGKGIASNVATLFVIDGSKALVKAIKSVFGRFAVIQRCQVHKKRNVLAHVSEKHADELKKRLSNAYNADDYNDALKSLKNTAAWLNNISPDAANSLREGMEETITVLKLELPELLRQSLPSTNIIESALSVARKVTSRVKRWQGGDMRKRWCLTGLLRAQEGFQKIKGASSLLILTRALDKLVPSVNTIDLMKKAA